MRYVSFIVWKRPFITTYRDSSTFIIHFGHDIFFSIHINRFLFIRSIADPFLIPINPYIRHWEAARFDIEPLKNLHEQRRRKRETVNDSINNKNNSNSTHIPHRDGPANIFNLNFFAHNR